MTHPLSSSDLPPQDSLEAALTTYSLALKALHKSQPQPTGDQVLAVLYGRDGLQRALETTEGLSGEVLGQVLALDGQLRQQALRISQVIPLADYRALLPQDTQGWWWHLETYIPPPPEQALDWLWKGLTLVCWPFNFALMVDLGKRFLSAGIGVEGVLAVVTPTLWAMLQANTELTQTGQEAFDRFLNRFNIPIHWREGVKFGSTATLLLGLVTVSANLARLGEWYNQQAIVAYDQGRTANAEEGFRRAIGLNPSNGLAHFNLGNLYQSLQQTDLARDQFQVAARSQVPQALNSLAALDIQIQDYDQAVARLNQGIDMAAVQNSPPALRYELLKNLGWARFHQQRYPEALESLTAAVAIVDDLERQGQLDRLPQAGSAACLLAKTLEAQAQPPSPSPSPTSPIPGVPDRLTGGNPLGVNPGENLAALAPKPKPVPGALVYWRRCAVLAQATDPSEDKWLHQAKERMGAAGTTP